VQQLIETGFMSAIFQLIFFSGATYATCGKQVGNIRRPTREVITKSVLRIGFVGKSESARVCKPDQSIGNKGLLKCEANG
jgi:hypothetical protein